MKQFLKTCSKCRKQKWNSSFSKNKSKFDGLVSQCKECDTERIQKYYQDNPQQKRKHQLKSKYKLTVEDYEVMFEEQNGVCKICRQSETTKLNGKIKMLAVDHNHSTEKIRGLLCSNCNKMLGLVVDNIETLKRAIKYLEETK